MARFGGWAIGLVAAGVLASGGPAHATNYTIGLGGAFSPDYDGSQDYEATPAWLLSINDFYDPRTFLVVTGPLLRSNFVPHPHFRAGLSGLWVPERDDVENNRVDDLDSTDTAIMLGGNVGWDFLGEPIRSLTLGVDAVYDVANDNGFLVTPRLLYSDALKGTPYSWGTELFANWASDDYMSEQFGINGNNAAKSGLDQYDADEGFKDAGLRLNGNYRFTEHWSTSLALQYKRMLGDAADSPIVDDEGDENQFLAAVTINYRF